MLNNGVFPLAVENVIYDQKSCNLSKVAVIITKSVGCQLIRVNLSILLHFIVEKSPTAASELINL